MNLKDERIREAVKHTEILRLPKQSLASFGVTNIYYYLVTEPSYTDLVNDVNETVIREGRVIAEKPKVVTPYYLSRIEGFSSEAKRYFEKFKFEIYANPGMLIKVRVLVSAATMENDMAPQGKFFPPRK